MKREMLILYLLLILLVLIAVFYGYDYGKSGSEQSQFVALFATFSSFTLIFFIHEINNHKKK